MSSPNGASTQRIKTSSLSTSSNSLSPTKSRRRSTSSLSAISCNSSSESEIENNKGFDYPTTVSKNNHIKSSTSINRNRTVNLPDAYELHRSDAAVDGNVVVRKMTSSHNHHHHYSNNKNNNYNNTQHQHTNDNMYHHETESQQSYSGSQVDSESYLDLHEAAKLQNSNHYVQYNHRNAHHQQNHHVSGGGINGGHIDDSSTILTANYASYNGGGSGGNGNTKFNDATDTVHEMHLALLYLLSNPDEFQKALTSANHLGATTTTLAQWNAEYYDDNESLITTDTEYINTVNNKKGGQYQLQQSQQQQQHQFHTPLPNSTSLSPAMNTNHHHAGTTTTTTTTTTTGQTGAKKALSAPLPFVVFSDDAEVVLPQAHTASQLFGLERIEGIELEAAAGIPAISQLFLRWLALMPGGDHLNLIDPPGLTVMRIAGGRYRVTAAHRVVWTWMNEFARLTISKNGISITSVPHSSSAAACEGTTGRDRSSDNDTSTGDAVDQLQIGDLVTMTIVDVFETDSNGKLLSYCPTFDNRAIQKTNPTTEALRKSSSKLLAVLNRAQKSKLAIAVARQASVFATALKNKVDRAVYGPGSNSKSNSPNSCLTSDGSTNRTRHDSREGVYPDDGGDDDLLYPTPGGGGNISNTTIHTTILAPSSLHGVGTTGDSSGSNSTRKNDQQTLRPRTTTTTSTHYLADDDLERHEV